MKLCHYLLISITLLSLPLNVKAASRQLQYMLPAMPDVSAPVLSDTEWRWLGQRRVVRLALYGPSRPPLYRSDPEHRLQGYLPDLAWTLTRSLGMTLEFIQYDNPEEAYSALEKKEIDFIFSPAGDKPRLPPDQVQTIDIAPAYPVEMKRKGNPVRGGAPFYPVTDKHVSMPSPGSEPGKQLAELAQGTVHMSILPAVEAYFLTQRKYTNLIGISRLSSRTITPYQFVFSHSDPALFRTMSKALKHLGSHSSAGFISGRWQPTGLIRYLTAPLELTDEEKAWVKRQREVRVAASVFNPPYFLSAEGHDAGIAPEILELVTLKTGLEFRFIHVDDSRDMQGFMQKNNIHMAAPMTWSAQRSRQYLMTVPFMFTPQVLVTRNTFSGRDEMKHVVLPPEHDLASWLTVQYPSARLTLTDNPGLAMQWVAEGRADVFLDTLISARYFVERVHSHTLRIQQELSLPDAAIAFAVRHSDPELRSLLNKTIPLIPADMITDILTRWKSTPAAGFDTWKIYRVEFYTGTAVAFCALAAAIIWAGLLWRKKEYAQCRKEHLQRENMFLSRLINGPPRPVYVVTCEGNIIHTNLAFSKYFDDTTAMRLSLSLFDIRHPLYPVWIEIIKAPPEGNSVIECEFQIEQNAGNFRCIRHWITRCEQPDNSADGFIGGWQDVTEYINMQNELMDARACAEQASQSKSRFLAVMSHEIRTPLSAIIGLLELHKQEGRTDTHLTDIAYETSNSLMSLIGDILDIARIESGKMTLAPRWCHLDHLMNSVMSAFGALARLKGITLTLYCQENYELLIDGGRLRQVLANLVGNAIKFTNNGYVRLTASLNNDGLNLQVRDSGLGITPEQHKKLFSPFEQGIPSGGSGSGLGLFISREIIELMGGGLTLQSEPGKGTLVCITLPVTFRTPSTADTALNQYAALPTETLHQRTPLHILVVDDHPANRLLISRQLALMGQHVTEAFDGADGLEKWNNGLFDVIITDCSMPVMDGPEMAERIRAKCAQIHIIGITANAQESERQRCIRAGMNDCLFRPVKLAMLSEALQKARNIRDALSQSQPGQWFNPENMNNPLPFSPHVSNDFISMVIEETEKDLTQARLALEANDYLSARRNFHRMAGTLAVTGMEELTEQCELLEELAEMEEEEAVIISHISDTEALLRKFRLDYYHTFPTVRQCCHTSLAS